jgi:heat shock protein HslJ
MQKIVILYSFFSAILFQSCSGQKKIANQPMQESKDSIVFYDTEYKTKQKSYKKEMQGTWNVVTMRRQQRAELESLTGVTIEFSADSAFVGKAPCNRMGGIYILKGTSVKFSKTYVTKMACDRIEQETAFLKLLEETVSAYAVSDNKLLLRDGSGNVVFECVR